MEYNKTNCLKNKDKIRIYQRIWYRKNPEKVKLYRLRQKITIKEWFKRNSHKIKEYNEKYKEKKKVWTQKNKERLKEYHKKWREKNMERDLRLKKTYYQKHKKRINLLSKERLIKRKLLCFAKYSNDDIKCACCGEREWKFLSIDHINNDGAEHRKKIGNKGGDHIYRWLVRNNFPKGFQVLCHNCNQAKGHYGICPHQQKNE